MAEIGQIVKVGFVSDVDGLYFHKRFKGSGHPFYEAVYEKAAKIDKGLADNMDTCIIKWKGRGEDSSGLGHTSKNLLWRLV